MAKRKPLEIATAITAVLIFGALATLAYMLQEIRTSNSNVEEILFARLDDYNRAIRQDANVAFVISTAERDPGALSAENRRLYLSYQRSFFDGWESAMHYNDAGNFPADRWDVWNNWYVDELRRRPSFGWTENRQYYSGAFLQHVDFSLAEP